jgi:hypothetical protein
MKTYIELKKESNFIRKEKYLKTRMLKIKVREAS